MFFKPSMVRLAIAAPLIGGMLTAASGQTIQPEDQNREISTSASARQCGFRYESASDRADGFGPFDSQVESVDQCPEALARAIASQQSTIGDSQLNAAGLARVLAQASVSDDIQARGDSVFEVEFTLNTPNDFVLHGQIRAAGAAPADSVTRVELGEDHHNTILDLQVEPGPNGALNVRDILETGRLQAGRFTIRIEARAEIDAQVPPAGEGEAAFDLVFEFSGAPVCPGDLNADNQVGLADLAVLLSNFGTQYGADPEDGDLDGDGDVDLADLSILLAAFGTTCA